MGYFIQDSNNKPINALLVQSVFIDPTDDTTVVIRFKNGEVSSKTFSSASEANSKLEEIKTALLSTGGGGGGGDLTNYVTFNNAKSYDVVGDYNPAHKKYVDEKISEVEMFKFPNTTIVGTPTITHGQISDFSKNDYLEFPFLVDFRDRTFEINFAFTTGTDITNQQNILDSDFGLAFAIRSKHLVIALSFNGTSWAMEKVGTFTLEPQTTYRVRISWDRLSYKVQYSTDGGNTYTNDITFGGTQAPYPKQMFIGVGKLANNYFTGIINLNYADLKINNTLVWQGMDDVGLSTRLAVDLSNIDNAGVQKIVEIVTKNIPAAEEVSF